MAYPPVFTPTSAIIQADFKLSSAPAKLQLKVCLQSRATLSEEWADITCTPVRERIGIRSNRLRATVARPANGKFYRTFATGSAADITGHPFKTLTDPSRPIWLKSSTGFGGAGSGSAGTGSGGAGSGSGSGSTPPSSVTTRPEIPYATIQPFQPVSTVNGPKAKAKFVLQKKWATVYVTVCLQVKITLMTYPSQETWKNVGKCATRKAENVSYLVASKTVDPSLFKSGATYRTIADGWVQNAAGVSSLAVPAKTSDPITLY